MSVNAIESKVASTKGLHVNVAAWVPDGPIRGIVAIVPGFNAHSGYYAWVAAQLNAAGFAAYAVDLRGRGKSDGERFYVESFDDYVSDVRAMVLAARAAHPGVPMFLLGHSAGGVVACLYALEYPSELAGLVCESFAFRVPAPDFALAVIKGIAHLAPHAHVLKLPNKAFSRDPATVAAMDADPLIAHEVQPTRTVAEMVKADERLDKSFAGITLPLLILHGTADTATKPSGSQRFHDAAGSTDKTLKLYPGYFHDPLNDTGKEAVMVDIVGWLMAHVTRNS
jgi:acylglycerol lipase